MCGKFDSSQLKALKEFLPNDDEASGLKLYVENAKKNADGMDAAMADLCPCEKYMAAMMNVPDAEAKFDCMIFETQFQSRITDITESIDILDKACNDVRESIRLRKLMAMILTLVNQINTGGSGNVAAGFTLDGLLKLNEVSTKHMY